MAKKKVKKKKASKKKTSTKKKKSSPKRRSVSTSTSRALTDNFIALQKVMTNLSIRFDELSGQISKLLDLFEISAKSLAEKDIKTGKPGKENKELIEKLDTLIDQNKIISRGLTLLHNGPPTSSPPIPKTQTMPDLEEMPPLPPNPSVPPASQTQSATRENNIGADQYQKSISSPPKKFVPETN